MKKIVFSLLSIIMLVAIALPVAMALPVASPAVLAQPSSWPTTWVGLTTDDNENGCNEHRNVADVNNDSYAVYYAIDSQYLYLRLETATSAGWPSTGSQGEARYKWWVDTAGTAAYVKGTSVYEAEFLLILEDRTDSSNTDNNRDQLGELTLMDDLTNITFKTRWNSGGSGAYITGTPDKGNTSSLWQRELGTGMAGVGGPQGVMGANIGYRIDDATTGGSFVDMYVSLAWLGNPSSLCLVWATDNHDPNLDQAPNCDRPIYPECLPLCMLEVTLSGDTTFCDNVGGTITANVTGGTSPFTYNWSASTANGTGSGDTFNATGSGNVSVTVTDDNGCSDSDSVAVTAYDSPTASASSNSPVYEGSTIELYGGPDNMTSYNWTGPGFTSSLRNPTRPNAATAMAGDYTLTVTDANGCSDDDTTTVTVRSRPPGGGGGGGGRAPCYLDIDMLGNITRVRITCTTSRTLEAKVAPDFNSTHFLEIDYGTTVICPKLGAAPEALMMRVANQSPPVPDGSALVGPAYNFTGNYGYKWLKYCSGVTFGQNVTIVLDYDPNEVPESTTSLAIAYYDTELGIWVSLSPDIGRVAEVGKATGLTNRFSTVAVIAELAPTVTPASFVGSALNIEQSPQVWKNIFVGVTGKDVTITANVANNGGQEGTYIAELKLNGETVDAKEVTLAAGQSQQVTFTLYGMDYGQYEVEVAGLSGEFTVSRIIDWWAIFGIILAVGLITWGVIRWIRRRKPAQPAESEVTEGTEE